MLYSETWCQTSGFKLMLFWTFISNINFQISGIVEWCTYIKFEMILCLTFVTILPYNHDLITFVWYCCKTNDMKWYIYNFITILGFKLVLFWILCTYIMFQISVFWIFISDIRIQISGIIEWFTYIRFQIVIIFYIYYNTYL